MEAVLKAKTAEPVGITFVYNWHVRILQPVNGFNVFGDTETFCTTYRSTNHEWYRLQSAPCMLRFVQSPVTFLSDRITAHDESNWRGLETFAIDFC